MQKKNAFIVFFLMIFSSTSFAVIFLDNSAFAFHEGGVGACEACHSMHGSVETGTGVNPYLLKGQSPSSLCLNCHEHAGDNGPTGSHISTPGAEIVDVLPPKQLSPGGDFGWLKKTYMWLPAQGQVMQFSPGERHGHNIVAPDYGYGPDHTYLEAPNGVYPSLDFSCVSCHDPHGQYRRGQDGSVAVSGNPISTSGSYDTSPDPDSMFSVGAYRLLGGKGYTRKSLFSSYAFVNDPPAAVSPNIYNRSEALTQTRVAYGSGMSEWCQNCHTTMHTISSIGSPTTPTTHPVGNGALLGFAISTIYNTYIKTGDLSGLVSTAYLSLVPFEEGTKDYLTLKTHARSDNTYLSGPDSTRSQVMCLTCHRAHASGWDGATRWNSKSSFVVNAGLYSQEGQVYQLYGQGRSEMEAVKAYYDIPSSRFAVNQGSLCNKCHGGVFR
jgi:predicted CXXCH cytochrome family protein